MVNGKKLNALSLRLGTIHGYPITLFLFNHVIEVLDTAIRELKKKKHPERTKMAA